MLHGCSPLLPMNGGASRGSGREPKVSFTGFLSGWESKRRFQVIMRILREPWSYKSKENLRLTYDRKVRFLTSSLHTASCLFAQRSATPSSASTLISLLIRPQAARLRPTRNLWGGVTSPLLQGELPREPVKRLTRVAIASLPRYEHEQRDRPRNLRPGDSGGRGGGKKSKGLRRLRCSPASPSDAMTTSRTSANRITVSVGFVRIQFNVRIS